VQGLARLYAVDEVVEHNRRGSARGLLSDRAKCLHQRQASLKRGGEFPHERGDFSRSHRWSAWMSLGRAHRVRAWGVYGGSAASSNQ
jgi:hypothetical protein